LELFDELSPAFPKRINTLDARTHELRRARLDRLLQLPVVLEAPGVVVRKEHLASDEPLTALPQVCDSRAVWLLRPRRSVMRKLLLSVVLVLALAPASALANDRSDRACFGEFASTFAQANVPSGQLVSQTAQANTPFGQVVSTLARACPSP
jgi:hypothetical protein